ncbi:MAG: DUF4160 domain-containing protein [Bacteroidetes bacterium]|nr:DUF4160 domain-containing protein [Bacteroidota bacterium]
MMFYKDHNPPHFHADYQEYEATIEIESGIIKGEMPRRALKLIFDWLDLHKEELLRNWELAQKQEVLFKIDPLT